MIANERQLSARDKMTQKLTIIGNRTAFNNEQSPYRIVSYKKPRNDSVKQVGGQAVLGRQFHHTTPWLPERHC